MEEKDAEMLALKTLRGLISNPAYFELLSQKLGDSTNNPIRPKLRRFFSSVLAIDFPHLNPFNGADILPAESLPSEALAILKTYALNQGPEVFVREFEPHFKPLQTNGVNHVEINELIGFIIGQKN